MPEPPRTKLVKRQPHLRDHARRLISVVLPSRETLRESIGCKSLRCRDVSKLPRARMIDDPISGLTLETLNCKIENPVDRAKWGAYSQEVTPGLGRME